MKNKLLCLILVGVLIFGGVSWYYCFNLQENVIYSQSVLNTTQPGNMSHNSFAVTRVQAINKAYDVFEQGLGICLYDSDITMHINLYRDQPYNNYQWVMSWYEEGGAATYSCTISADSGKILNLYAIKANSEKKNEIELYDQALQEEKTGVFLKSVGVNLNNYKLEKVEFISEEAMQNSYVISRYRNLNDETDVFDIEWNQQIGMVQAYEVRTGKSE